MSPDLQLLLDALSGRSENLPLDPAWLGVDPSSAEWQSAIQSRPFNSFPIHPLPPKLQAFLDTQPDLDQRERDAICQMLEQLYHLPPLFYVIDQNGQFIVELEP